MIGKTPSNSHILEILPSDSWMLYYLNWNPVRLRHTHVHVAFVKAAAPPDLSSAALREHWAVMDRKVMKPPFADGV